MNPRVGLMYEVWQRRQRGQSLRSIARTLGISRKTVSKLLAELAERRARGDDALSRMMPKERTPRASKLDSHEDFIAQQLRLYPNIRATRLHEELKLRGFDGGYTIVRERLNRLRPEVEQSEPDELVITPPGKQAQVDWSPYKLADGTKIYCFSCVLGHSRFMYARFTTDMRQLTIFQQLRRAFDAFGGVPKECVFDTMPGIIDRWELGQPIFNLAAVDFAVYHHFELHAAPRYYAKYKGKVERPYRFIEESFFNGRTFYTLEQANDTMSWWLEHRANCRTHRMTKRVPAEALLEERPSFNSLPLHPYDDREIALRLVDSYGYVSFDGNYYRAPGPIGRWIYVRASEDEVDIAADAANVVVTHPRSPRNAHQYVPPPQRRKRRRPISELMQCLEMWGPIAKRFGEQIRASKRCSGAELERIVALQKSYSLQDILAAVKHADRYGAYGARELERILQLRAEPRTFEDHLAASAREHIRRAMDHSPVQQRELSAYTQLLGSITTNKEPVDDDETR
jgi:transposase